MNRVTRLTYLIIGVFGGMLAVWACGDDTLGGTGGGRTSGGGGTAHAQTEPSDCKQWSVSITKFSLTDPQVIDLDEGQEPFGAVDANGGMILTRTCKSK